MDEELKMLPILWEELNFSSAHCHYQRTTLSTMIGEYPIG